MTLKPNSIRDTRHLKCWYSLVELMSGFHPDGEGSNPSTSINAVP